MKSADMKRALTALGVAALVFALAPEANAMVSPAPLEALSPPLIQLTAGGCGPGYRRTLIGYHCVREVTQHRCQAGMHSEPFPNGRGYRCVFN